MSKSNKKAARLLDSTVFLVIIAAIVVLVNVILSLPAAPRLRLDLTQDQRYTLSDASAKMVAGLGDEPLTIKFFISEDLQYPDHNLEQRVRDLLEEYEAAGRGSVRFEIIHPEEVEVSEDGEESAEDEGPKGFGIQKVPVGVRGKDEVVLRNVYKGMAFVYGEDVEVIGELRGTDNLEYEVSKRIKSLTTSVTERHKVGFVKGFGGPADTPNFVAALNEAFAKIYGELVSVDALDMHDPAVVRDMMGSCAEKSYAACSASKFCEVPSSVNTLKEEGRPLPEVVCKEGYDALVVLNAQSEFTPSARFAIDQFLMRGRGVAWMQTTSALDENIPLVKVRKPVKTGLEEQFTHYGLELRQDTVLDRNNNIISKTITERGEVEVSNPAMPLFRDIDAESTLTRNVPVLSFPVPSSIVVSKEAEGNDALEVRRLVSTEEGAVRRKTLGTFNHESLAKPDDGEETGKYLVAASVQGKIPSFWGEREKPASEPASNPSDKPLDFPDPVQEASEGARVVVVGSGEFMFPNPQTGFSRQYSGIGALFLLNVVDWLIQDEALVSIRSKGTPQVIKGVQPEEYGFYQFANIVGAPLIFVLVGLLLWWTRRRRKASLKL